MFENRNNYCNKKTCNLCEFGIIHCINIQIYIDLETTTFDCDAYGKLIKDINNELAKFINLELI